jgi:hypothetical protein
MTKILSKKKSKPSSSTGNGIEVWRNLCYFACSLSLQLGGMESFAQVKNIYGNNETAKCYSYSSADMIQWCLDSYEKQLQQVLERQQRCIAILQRGGSTLPSYCKN